MASSNDTTDNGQAARLLPSHAYLLIDGEVADSDLGLLQSLLAFVDDHLDSEWAWARSGNPFPENAEFYAGLGFVGCQKYLVATCGELGADWRHLDRGPRFNERRTVVEVINAAANVWKHRDMWGTETSRARAMTEAVLQDVPTDERSETWLLGVLGALVGNPDARFVDLIAPLVQWRNELLIEYGVFDEQDLDPVSFARSPSELR